jgi:hypothetical protein
MEYGEWLYRCPFLELSISWRQVSSFPPLPLYPQEKGSQCPLDRRLGAPHRRSGRRGKDIFFILSGVPVTHDITNSVANETLITFNNHNITWVTEQILINLVRKPCNIKHFPRHCSQLPPFGSTSIVWHMHRCQASTASYNRVMTA